MSNAVRRQARCLLRSSATPLRNTQRLISSHSKPSAAVRARPDCSHRQAGTSRSRRASTRPETSRASLQTRRSMSFTHPSRNLGDIVKIHLMRQHSEAKVKEIWEEHHKDKPMATGRTMTVDDHKVLHANGTACPFFVFPMRNPLDPSQFFTMLSQYQNGSFFCCSLEDYRKNPSNAQPAFVLSLFDDLSKDPKAYHCRNLVLVRGDIVSASLTQKDAERLSELLIRFYSNESDFRKVLQFNKRPREFDFNKFMAECP